VTADALYLLALAAVGFAAGAVASVSGFGVGSLLTPLFALEVGTKLAVAAVSIPHAIATALRLWTLRASVDRRLLVSFGLMSAAGGLLGALLNAHASSPALAVVFGVLLVSTGVSGLFGLAERVRFRGWVAWVAGAVSGVFGGMVGNQGGLRAAAMFGFDVPRHAFVATATAVGLIVDGARVPVYLATQGDALRDIGPLLAVATLGTVAGTLAGRRLLDRVPEALYRRVVSLLLVALGISVLVRAGG
jgi:hypothetical protein